LLIGLRKQLVLIVEPNLLLAGRRLRESFSTEPLGFLRRGLWRALMVWLRVLREIERF